MSKTFISGPLWIFFSIFLLWFSKGPCVLYFPTLWKGNCFVPTVVIPHYHTFEVWCRKVLHVLHFYGNWGLLLMICIMNKDFNDMTTTVAALIKPMFPWQTLKDSLLICCWCQLISCETCSVKIPVVQQEPSPATGCRGCWSTCFSGDPWGRLAGARCPPCGCCSGPPGSWRPPSCAGGPARMTWTPHWCCRGTAGPRGRRRPGCGNPAGTRHHRQRSWDPFSSLDLQQSRVVETGDERERRKSTIWFDFWYQGLDSIQFWI